jgi:hypothetical protein
MSRRYTAPFLSACMACSGTALLKFTFHSSCYHLYVCLLIRPFLLSFVYVSAMKTLLCSFQIIIRRRTRVLACAAGLECAVFSKVDNDAGSNIGA